MATQRQVVLAAPAGWLAAGQEQALLAIGQGLVPAQALEHVSGEEAARVGRKPVAAQGHQVPRVEQRLAAVDGNPPTAPEEPQQEAVELGHPARAQAQEQAVPHAQPGQGAALEADEQGRGLRGVLREGLGDAVGGHLEGRVHSPQEIYECGYC